MTMNKSWLLPEGVEEILPPQAGYLENLCRSIIDLYRTWGYQLVMPPMIEFLESLLTGTGSDLDLQTFKLTDQLSGRLMGVRADTTPQVARLDARNINCTAPTRLCYLGTVLHTRPAGHGASRSPLQVGAELYGHRGRESDAEILVLMLETLRLAGIRDVYIDLGHVGIYQGIISQLRLGSDQEAALFDVLQRKAGFELEELIKSWSLPRKAAAMLEFMIEANGDMSLLNRAAKKLSSSSARIKRSLAELQDVARLVKKLDPDAPLNFDLAELRGYHYHTGIVFTAYVPGSGQGIAFGGRYDDIGRAFGRARPATGFSTDLKILLALTEQSPAPVNAIFAPCKPDKALALKIRNLRDKGEVVINELPGQKGTPGQMQCNRKLVKKNGRWQVVKI